MAEFSVMALVLSAGMFLNLAPALAQDTIFARADRKCVACHRRLSFREPPPPGEEREVHVAVNEFLHEPHALLSCGSCHEDFRKIPHSKGATLEVDCVSCHRRHPEFVLRDGGGEPVLETGKPMSTMRTCGVCHDTEFIENSSDHADAGASQLYGEERPVPWEAGPGYFGGWDPMRYDVVLNEAGEVDLRAWLRRYGDRHIGGGPAAGLVEMDCLLCHTDVRDHSLRRELIGEGDFAWANSAPLETRDVLEKKDGEWQWNPLAFQDDGRLHVGVIDVQNPDTEVCSQCHGLASTDADTPLKLKRDIHSYPITERTGQVFAPHPVGDSGLNLTKDDAAGHPLDVHAARGLECVNCHYSLGNPVYFRKGAEDRPVHIRFDPRRPEREEFLDRPTHQVAKGRSIHGLAADESINTLRHCKSCHDAGEVHDWLPYQNRHFEALSCLSCHVPKVYGPALQAIDWTILDETGEPLRQYRGVEGDPDRDGAEFAGYRPILLPRFREAGKRELTPFNGVASWFWLAGDPPRPVSREDLRKALLQDDSHHPDLVAALDRNDDGRLERSELQLTTVAQLETVRQRLESIGLSNLTVETELTPYPVFHNVGSENFANQECAYCHHKNSALEAPFPLSSYLPGGLKPSSEGYPSVELLGNLVINETGGISEIPDLSLSGFYVLGLHSVPWIDALGLFVIMGVVFGVLVHLLIRVITRPLRPPKPTEVKRVYMYDAYERLWHWVQAFMILYLIFSGLVIHKPHLFSGFSFPLMVETHNIFGMILLVNAGLALFYNLASGKFQRYLPEPKDFFTRAIMQTLYYTRGIFKGEPHPFEKTRQKRLNPLQEITYFAILNILLPAQIITGIMIYWGQQNWPRFFTTLGGLPVLAPVHTGIAWLFAAFIVLHVYLVTASGISPLAAIRAMITGWEKVDLEHYRPRGEEDQAAASQGEA